ncbi:hypothetical protein A1C_03350 [Rickettsia akari str. Hartford]|uniref:Uncharacterized protein n=1 Tax=Rickettsia akari (strain Hartford) TaxID=293614 RepID=A8GNI1_RICAH|nr:hypothetical protein [Rickettsia akari]ABV74956.1 hypothetical protein A1C_03350 [Rickettsia akari str. Hartford]
MQAVQAYKVDGTSPIIASNLEGGFVFDKKYLFLIFSGFVWQEDGKFPILFSSKDQEYLNTNNNHEITLLY